MEAGWHPDDWQAHCEALLRRRYGFDYQGVPAKDRGDLGIEGFSRDGCAYQCYVAEPGLTTTQLYTRQRDKMTTDIGKLIRNDVRLLEILRPTRLGRWVFMVPRFESRELLRHAAAQAARVTQSRLACATAPFVISVVTEDDFVDERAELLKSAYQIPLEYVPASDAVAEAWATAQSTQLDNLERKLRKMPVPSTAFDRELLRRHIIFCYLDGQQLEAEMRGKYADLWVTLTHIRTARGLTLVPDALVSPLTPQQLLTQLVESLAEELATALAHFAMYARVLAWGVVSTWLVECPLDFPEPGNA